MNVQPIKKLIAPNDKLTKKVFSFGKDFNIFVADSSTKDSSTPTEFSYLEGKLKIKTADSFEVIEQVETKFSMMLITDYLDEATAERYASTPLDAFDRAVFTAVCSQCQAGSKLTTVGAIYRIITGKPAGKHQTPTSKQAAAIRESVDKMSRIRLAVQLKDTVEKFGYNGGVVPKLRKYILPCIIRDVAGIDEIEIRGESPLMRIAKIKSQLLNFDAETLNVGKVHASRLFTAAKFYCTVRVGEIVQHKLKATLTFSDVLEKCGVVSDCAGERRRNETVERAIISTLESYKARGIVTDYESVKDGGGKFQFKYKKQVPMEE